MVNASLFGVNFRVVYSSHRFYGENKNCPESAATVRGLLQSNNVKIIKIKVMTKVEKIIETNKCLLLEKQTYILTKDFLHCDNHKFVCSVQKETGGYIEDLSLLGFGYLLHFTMLL
jgi:hypothetical protein